MSIDKTSTEVLEVRVNSEKTTAVTFRTSRSPSGLLFPTEEFLPGMPLEKLKIGYELDIETKGPLDMAGSEFIALYDLGCDEPFYKA